jgi:hypothetical protein
VEEDLLGAFQVARAIHRTIAGTPAAWSTRIGVYGRWGTGKTGVLKLLGKLESQSGAIVIGFSAWAASGEAGIIVQLYDALALKLDSEGIKAPLKPQAKKLAAVLRKHIDLAKTAGRMAEAISPVPKGTADVVAGVAHTALAAMVFNKADLDDLLRHFEGRRIVVFIDDLDRADPRTIPKTLLALREMLDWQGFSFVLAFDPLVVARSLAEYSSVYGEKAQSFLEKVIDISFDIPKPTPPQKLALAAQAFRTCCPFVPPSVLEANSVFLPDEPRRIKQIARRLGVLHNVSMRHAAGDLDWSSLVLHAVLQEASVEAAAKVVELGARSNAWVGIGDKEEQRRERNSKLEDQLKSLFGDARGELERPVQAGIALLKHWKYFNIEEIRYHARLTTEEPAITLYELERLAAQWATAGADQLVADAISQGVQHSGLSRARVASELVSAVVARYGRALHTMSEASTILERESAQTLAHAALRFLDYLWSYKGDPELRTAREASAAAMQLIELTLRWAAWVNEHGDTQLRDAEQKVALRAVDACNDPEGAFHRTNPYWEDRDNRDEPELTNWKVRIRAQVAQRIARRILARFKLPDGLEPIARGHEEWTLQTWFIESGASPLYVLEPLRSLLLAELSRDPSLDRQGRIAQSASSLLFLEMLCGTARGGTFGGKDSPVTLLLLIQPMVIERAWALGTSLSVPMRVVEGVQSLRARLIDASVPEALLPVPAWLVDASKRRDQAEAKAKAR